MQFLTWHASPQLSDELKRCVFGKQWNFAQVYILLKALILVQTKFEYSMYQKVSLHILIYCMSTYNSESAFSTMNAAKNSDCSKLTNDHLVITHFMPNFKDLLANRHVSINTRNNA